ncbi:hypothetical protein IscW_ISCW009808 [Ixodes scapularis]|uniref:Uncharacterized protein n=1 Tax=Ixodes scapularis TaxID=6945 RepID=B7PZ67_IXOSC|nr:hypothetical protein IscW_ISCW009808 [Ixodes scapularis]|eukprot:XP_002404875.1 hypothetical protein IscW_ISCW009808 [Ixodes scapularis]
MRVTDRTVSVTRVPATFNAVRFAKSHNSHSLNLSRSAIPPASGGVAARSSTRTACFGSTKRSDQWVHPASLLECVIAKCRVVSIARNSVALARPGAEEWMQLTGDGELRRCNYYSEHEAVHRDNWESSEYSWLVCKQVRLASQTSSFRSLTA